MKGGEVVAFQYKNSRGDTFQLYTLEVNLKSGRKQRIYFFSGKNNPGAWMSLDVVPAGYQVIESQRTCLPILKKA